MVLVLVSGTLLAGCSSQVAPTISLPVSTQLGPVGKQFKASFPSKPRTKNYILSGVKQPQYGVGVQSNTTYVSGGSDSSEMDVWIVTLTNFVPPRRIDPFLRSYLSSSHGGRIIKWFGLPASEEFVPGCDPSGQCSGTVGNLVVLDGTTLYFVFAHENSMPAALEEVRSFRVVR